jgi:hypothetical protein
VPVLDQAERAALVDADRELSNLQKALEAAARSDALDEDLFDRLGTTARAAAERVNHRLPPQIDPDARDEIRKRLIDLLVLHPTPTAGLLDLADRALIEAEAIRHIVRDLLQEQPAVELVNAGAIVGELEAWFPGLRVHQLAELLGVSDRQLQRLRGTSGASSARMQIVLRLAAILRHSWTDEGVYAWFLRQRPELGGRRPLDLLEDAANERDLILAARGGRMQGGI